MLSYAVSIAVHTPYTSEALCNPQMIAYTNHGIWIQSIPLCTVLSWQLRPMSSWGQHYTQSKTRRTVTHLRGLAISNVMNLGEPLCLMPWCLQGASWWVFCSHYPMETKLACWIWYLTLNVDKIWASVSCLLPQIFLVNFIWPQSL